MDYTHDQPGILFFSMQAYTHEHTYARTHTHTHEHTYARKYTHTHTHTHTKTHTHTHTQAHITVLIPHDFFFFLRVHSFKH